MAVEPEPAVKAVLAIMARGNIVKQYPISTAFALLAAALEEADGNVHKAEREFHRSVQRLVRAR